MHHHLRRLHLHLTHHLTHVDAGSLIDPGGFGLLDILTDAATQPHILLFKTGVVLVFHLHHHVRSRTGVDVYVRRWHGEIDSEGVDDDT